MRALSNVCGSAYPAALSALVVASLGCASPDAAIREAESRALTLSITDLQMHLRADAYHSFAHVDEQGRNVFSVALWRLDRLADQRDARNAGPDEDNVIQFARGRALARLRRYADAAEAYGRVAASDGVLSEPAQQDGKLMELFASLAEVASHSLSDQDAELARIEAWADEWLHVAEALGDSPYAPSARLEAESWEQARVELLAAMGRSPEAIRACVRLLQRHRDSKLYARHLIRLGDLHAETARLEHVRSRTERRTLDVNRYERSLERAFSAYELASETRKSVLRREARSKIEALLAYHEGVRTDVR